MSAAQTKLHSNFVSFNVSSLFSWNISPHTVCVFLCVCVCVFLCVCVCVCVQLGFFRRTRPPTDDDDDDDEEQQLAEESQMTE